MEEIRFSGVSYRYGQGAPVLNRVDLSVRPGEFLCLVGPSGCGKTTLLRLLAGFMQPTEGMLSSGGVPLSQAGVRTALVSQGAALFPWMTVRDNVAFAARKTRRLTRAQAREAAAPLLEAAGISAAADRYPCALSGGMRQRAALACALATEAELLLLDEPFSALDHRSRVELRTLLSGLWRDRACAAVFVTHDIDEGIVLGDRVVFMGHGSPAAELAVPFARPRAEAEILVTPECCSLRKQLISLFYRQEAAGI